jgi:hypothetical protein
MAAPTGAFVMRDATVTVESVEYANQCTKARLVPNTPVQTVRTLVPDGVVQDIDTPVWTLELTILQINSAGGLAKALRDAVPGDELDVILAPKNGTGNAKATFTVIAMQPPFGGEQGNFATVELTLPVKGAPVCGTL